jgi:tetratricopeptide (TPR) repeat protein
VPETPLEPADPNFRRRSRHRHGQSRSGSNRKNPASKNKPKRSRQRGKDSPRVITERWIITFCILLGVFACLALGFWIGQRHAIQTDASTHEAKQDAPIPTAETAALLDEAFTGLKAGNYDTALLKFQKAQETQPSLVGLDYLIAKAAQRAGESVLAGDAAAHAIAKNESAEEARTLLAMMNLSKEKSVSQDGQQLADPAVAAEAEIKQLVATHPDDAEAFLLWGDLLRSVGSYSSAADILHRGIYRANPTASSELLSAKEQLARLQDQPAKTAPSLSELTSMTAEQSLVAAFASLQLKQSETAAAFFDHAQELYSPEIFRELMNDIAFADYRQDKQLKKFFK